MAELGAEPATVPIMPVKIVPVTTPAQLDQAIAIRHAVFVVEQGVAADLEMDGREGEATHLLALDEGRPVGTLRLRRLADGVAKIERVAVLAECRGRAIGQQLMATVMAEAARQGLSEALLHAQTAAAPFYAKLGFAPFGAPFEEDGIPHVAMRRPLAPAAGA